MNNSERLLEWKLGKKSTQYNFRKMRKNNNQYWWMKTIPKANWVFLKWTETAKKCESKNYQIY